ncbi:HAD family hydrolase [Chloroflexota bacterium]
MKYKAVIFDLFGTLIKNYSIQKRETVLRQMASILSAPSESFVRLWYDTFNERCTGVLKTPEDNTDYVCQRLGVPVDDSQVSLTARIRFELTAQTMIPVPRSIAMLSHLKSEGYKIGLITDCSAEVPTIWQDTPWKD